MTAGRKLHDADLVGSDGKFLRARSNQANGALCVFEFNRVVVLGPKSVIKDKSGNAGSVKPVCDLAAFVIRRQIAVTPAGKYDHGSMWSALRVRRIRGDVRPILVGVTQCAGNSPLPK